MMPIANRRNHGWFTVVCSKRGKVLQSHNVSCSQDMKFTYSKDSINVIDGYVQFYFPTDWISKLTSRKLLFKDWLDFVSTTFYKVDHLGTKKSNELGININGYLTNQEQMEIGVGIEGDIVNDSWEVFRMEMKSHDREKEKRQYCAYCMVRYLFSDHYEQIPRNFYRMRHLCNTLGLKDIENFHLIQLSHYYFTGHNGFYETYSLIKIPNVNSSVYRLLTLEEYDKGIKNPDTLISDIFSKKGTSQLTVLNFQKLLEINNIKEIYGQTK